MKTEPNDSAFARAAVYGVEEGRLGVCEDGYPGLTKREYFAAIAMQGLLSNSAMAEPLARGVITAEQMEASLSNQAVRCADALIEELNKP